VNSPAWGEPVPLIGICVVVDAEAPTVIHTASAVTAASASASRLALLVMLSPL
jgi:hypothetical protein